MQLRSWLLYTLNKILNDKKKKKCHLKYYRLSDTRWNIQNYPEIQFARHRINPMTSREGSLVKEGDRSQYEKTYSLLPVHLLTKNKL